jgi:hypothetical protein
MNAPHYAARTSRAAHTKLAVCLLLATSACGAPPRVRLQAARSALAISQPALYPETLEVDQRTGKFLVSSIREGAVYEVGLDAVPRPLIQDPKLTSVLGIAVDQRSNRLLATNSDLGASVKRSARGIKKEAGVGAYDLTTGEALFYADLSAFLPAGDHLINGIAVDADGNAYVTDSFSPVIYKVDQDGGASVFLQSETFAGPGINLNGIAYHPSGYLLVIKKSTGELFHIPLHDPQSFRRVGISRKLTGGDGLLLVGKDQMLVVANQTPDTVSNAIFVLRSEDGWKTGKVLESRPLGDVYPTTCASLNGNVYVLSSHLNEWLAATEPMRAAIEQQGRLAEIRQIAELIP